MESVEVINELDFIDTLTAKSAQLVALISCTYGEGAIDFEVMGDTIKTNYFWLLEGLAREVDSMACQIARQYRGAPAQ